MTFIGNQQLTRPKTRTYHVYVPDTPATDRLPTIVAFHGHGQDVQTIAARWGIDPPNPVAPLVENYILVFPEADPDLDGRWTHYRQSTFHTVPEYDLRFVGELLDEITTAGVFTAANGDPVAADPDRIYAAGFSNGSGMVWQLAYSTPAMVARFQGFASVSTPLVPDKPQKYQARFGAAPPVPMIYINGTLDTTFSSPRTLQDIPVDMTYPSYTVQEMLNRNGVAAGLPASTQLVPGSTNVTEVVMQEWVGTEAFACVLVLNGGHNWPTPATNANPPVASHFNATRAIVEFWRNHAGLP